MGREAFDDADLDDLTLGAPSPVAMTADDLHRLGRGIQTALPPVDAAPEDQLRHALERLVAASDDAAGDQPNEE